MMTCENILDHCRDAYEIYRVSKKKLTPFKFKFAGNLSLEFDNSHFSNDYNAF